jgi:hypothetical protein
LLQISAPIHEQARRSNFRIIRAAVTFEVDVKLIPTKAAPTGRRSQVGALTSRTQCPSLAVVPDGLANWFTHVVKDVLL